MHDLFGCCKNQSCRLKERSSRSSGILTQSIKESRQTVRCKGAINRPSAVVWTANIKFLQAVAPYCWNSFRRQTKFRSATRCLRAAFIQHNKALKLLSSCEPRILVYNHDIIVRFVLIPFILYCQHWGVIQYMVGQHYSLKLVKFQGLYIASSTRLIEPRMSCLRLW